MTGKNTETISHGQPRDVCGKTETSLMKIPHSSLNKPSKAIIRQLESNF